MHISPAGKIHRALGEKAPEVPRLKSNGTSNDPKLVPTTPQQQQQEEQQEQQAQEQEQKQQEQEQEQQ